MRSILFYLLLSFNLAFTAVYAAEDQSIILSGNWGNKPNEIGISYPSKGVLPTAPFMCLGGFIVSESGDIWISDSINQKIKLFTQGKVKELALSYQGLGELFLHETKLYVTTYKPNGIAVINSKNLKEENHLPINFVTPGRIFITQNQKILVEEVGKGVWITEKGKTQKHPAAALEAIGVQNTIFGTEFNFEKDSRSLIKATLEPQKDEPQMHHLIRTETGGNIIFGKIAGVHQNQPVFAYITEKNPNIYQLVKTDEQGNEERKELPISDSPYFLLPFKIGTDGSIYVFSAHPSNGWKIKKNRGFF